MKLPESSRAFFAATQSVRFGGTPCMRILEMRELAEGTTLARGGNEGITMQTNRPAQQDHVVAPVLLTIFAILVGIVMAKIGREPFVLYAITLPVPLSVLWFSRNEPRIEEQGAVESATTVRGDAIGVP